MSRLSRTSAVLLGIAAPLLAAVGVATTVVMMATHEFFGLARSEPFIVGFGLGISLTALALLLVEAVGLWTRPSTWRGLIPWLHLGFAVLVAVFGFSVNGQPTFASRLLTGVLAVGQFLVFLAILTVLPLVDLWLTKSRRSAEATHGSH